MLGTNKIYDKDFVFENHMGGSVGVFPIFWEQEIFLNIVNIDHWSSKLHRALDLCTGSGVMAIAYADKFSQVVGVDVSSRALEFAKFNAFVNNASNINWIMGNLFDLVDGQFDLITANPPYNPQMGWDSISLFSGEIGEDCTNEILEKAPDYLTETGFCYIITSMFLRENETFVDTILKKTDFKSCRVMHSKPMSIDTYVKEVAWFCDKKDQSSLSKRFDKYNISHACYGVLRLQKTGGSEMKEVHWKNYVEENMDSSDLSYQEMEAMAT